MYLALCIFVLALAVNPKTSSDSFQQEPFPDPPNDLTRIYYPGVGGKLIPLPFEHGLVPLNVFVPAVETKIFPVRVTGPTAETLLTNENLRFYAYVADRMDPPPHQLVRLASKSSDRELKISLVKGQKGYAPFEVDTIRLDRRLLERLQVNVGPSRIIFVNYMELRPHTRLASGEYAIIGDSLADMATFRIR